MAEEEKWRSSHWQVESELAKFRWKCSGMLICTLTSKTWGHMVYILDSCYLFTCLGLDITMKSLLNVIIP